MDEKTKAYLAECDARAHTAIAKANAATHGPYDIHRYDDDGGGISWQIQQSDAAPSKDADGVAIVLSDFPDIDNANARRDAEFYQHARTALPDLAERALALSSMVRERDATIAQLRPDAEAWRKGFAMLEELRARVIPCGHTIGDLIGGEGSVTKCGACLASVREYRAMLAARLKAAIRRQTVDIDDGNTPNGPVEEALEGLANALTVESYRKHGAGAFVKACDWGAKLTTALTADTKELCEAASAYFGEDFNKP